MSKLLFPESNFGLHDLLWSQFEYRVIPHDKLQHRWHLLHLVALLNIIAFLTMLITHNNLRSFEQLFSLLSLVLANLLILFKNHFLLFSPNSEFLPFFLFQFNLVSSFPILNYLLICQINLLCNCGVDLSKLGNLIKIIFLSYLKELFSNR